jgi:hypothetical protein
MGDGFDPGANNTVETLAVQSDGKILVGGFFTALGGGSTGQFQAHITVSDYTMGARAFCPRVRVKKLFYALVDLFGRSATLSPKVRQTTGRNHTKKSRYEKRNIQDCRTRGLYCLARLSRDNRRGGGRSSDRPLAQS